MSQTTSQPTAQSEPSTSPLKIRLINPENLLDHAVHVQQPSDLVIAPVDLHRRNLKKRIAQAEKPLSAFEFSDGPSVATRLLDSSGRSTQSLDRIDRLAILEEILSEEGRARELFWILLGLDPASNVQAVEKTRTEIEAVTNYHPSRVRAYRKSLQTLTNPIAADAHDALYGVLAVEGALRQYAEKAPTDTELLRRATRVMVNSNGSVWKMAYPKIQRVRIVGLSNVPAPLVDLTTAIGRTTDIEAAICVRPATGRALRERLPQTTVDNLGEVFIG